MKVTIIQTITKTFDESRILLTSRVSETYLITPAEGKILRNKHTGQTFFAGLCVNKEQDIKNYEEITKNEG